MNELSLFTGGGGGVLASKYFLNLRTIGYVENDEDCQILLAQRIKDGLIDNAPIFTDIKTFISSGSAKLYKGIANIISAGFPCQPFSQAGKMLEDEDERNLWPETCDCIRIIQPEIAYLENAARLSVSRYFATILSDLYKIGYNAKWCRLSAEFCGANHERKRTWLMAYPISNSIW